MRIVLDTNVALAALLWRGTSYELLGLALAGTLQCFASDALLAELQRVLGYPKLAQRIARIDSSPAELLADYRAIVSITPPAAISPSVADDPTDDAILACAIAAAADLVVSGDAHLLNLKQFHGIDIVEPNAALQALRKLPAKE